MMQIIKSMVKNSLFLTKAIAFLAYPLYAKKVWLVDAINDANSKGIGYKEINEKKIKMDIFVSKYHYQQRPSEFFIYQFPKLSDLGRKEFVGEIERRKTLKKLGTKETEYIFYDKYETYKYFKEYFERDVLKLPTDGQKKFEEFIIKNNQFIVKPLNQACGRGIYKVNVEKENCSADELYGKILKNGDCIVEGIIIQAKEFSQFHPNSVNTLRVMTLVRNNEVKIIHAFLRFGRNGMDVDNGGQGGIIASVDLNTGVVDSLGITESREEFTYHPDTGVQIIGFHVPEFDKGIELAKELAMVVPQQACIGWDLALTSNGWVVVEGNHGPGFIGPQLTHKKGSREVFDRYFNK